MNDERNQVLARINLIHGKFLDLNSEGEAHFSDLLVWFPPTTIGEADESDCRTHIKFEIPSALYGVPSSVQLNSMRLDFELRPRSISAIGEALRIDEITSKTNSIVLSPDSKGRSSVTSVEVQLSEYVVLHDVLNQLCSGGPATEDDLRIKIKDLAINAMACINEFIDVYSLAMSNMSLQRVSASDIARIDVWQTLRDDSSILNFAAVFLPFDTSCSFNVKAGFDPTIESSIEEALTRYISLDASYRIAQRYLAESFRAMDSADYAMACIHAVMACEEAAQRYVRACLISPKISEQQKESLNKIMNKQINMRPNLECLLNKLVPIICKTRRDYPSLDVGLCNKLRNARNDATHGIEIFNKKYKRSDLSNWIGASKRYVDYLIATQPR